MPVIDIDAHFYEPFDWLLDANPELAAVLPAVDPLTLILTTAFGEVLSTLPPAVRPDPFEPLPRTLRGDGDVSDEQRRTIGEMVVPFIEAVRGGHDARERVAYLDEQGIDEQWVLPTFAFNPIAYLRRTDPSRTPELISTYNGWAFDQLDGSQDRLRPVVLIDPKTMDRAQVEAELVLARSRGARSFAFWPGPVDGVPLSHRDFDWFWAAAADHGMFPMVHVGAGRPAIDPGWLDNGRPFPSRVASYLLQLHQPAELLISELVLSGTFLRHPALRILVCELGIDWLPPLVGRLDRAVHHPLSQRMWSHDLLPSELIARHVRVSPLHDDPTLDVFEQAPAGSLVFSTDYPHTEGGTDAHELFKKVLAPVDPARQEAFFGATIAADLAATA